MTAKTTYSIYYFFEGGGRSSLEFGQHLVYVIVNFMFWAGFKIDHFYNFIYLCCNHLWCFQGQVW